MKINVTSYPPGKETPLQIKNRLWLAKERAKSKVEDERLTDEEHLALLVKKMEDARQGTCENQGELGSPVRPRIIGEKIGGGSEAKIFALGDNLVFKEIIESGIFIFNPDGSYGRSCSAEDIELKARLINLLDGMPTSQYRVGEQGFYIQDRGYGSVSEEEINGLKLPYHLTAGRGHYNRIETDGQTFLVSDLHHDNFIKDAEGEIRLFNLIIGRVNDNAPSLIEPESDDLLASNCPSS